MKRKRAKFKNVMSVMLLVLMIVPVFFLGSALAEVSSIYTDKKGINIVFSQEMDCSSVSEALSVEVVLAGIGYGTVSGMAVCDAATADFISSADLIPGLDYRIKLSTEVRDAEGNPLDSAYESSFIVADTVLGTVNVLEKDGVKIHTYLSNALQATHIIESENSLVLVDSQFMAPFAVEFREYADSLGKPIERVIISHAHPDHFFGLGAAFEDLEDIVYALEGTRQFIEEVGPGMLENMKPRLGDAAPEKIVVPGQTLEPGTQPLLTP